MLNELRAYLDTLTITSENIGNIRRSLFFPWDSEWNAWVRDETASREGASAKGQELERLRIAHDEVLLSWETVMTKNVELEAENARFRDELATPLGRMLAREKEKVQELEREVARLKEALETARQQYRPVYGNLDDRDLPGQG